MIPILTAKNHVNHGHWWLDKSPPIRTRKQWGNQVPGCGRGVYDRTVGRSVNEGRAVGSSVGTFRRWLGSLVGRSVVRGKITRKLLTNQKHTTRTPAAGNFCSVCWPNPYQNGPKSDRNRMLSPSPPPSASPLFRSSQQQEPWNTTDVLGHRARVGAGVRHFSRSLFATRSHL